MIAWLPDQTVVTTCPVCWNWVCLGGTGCTGFNYVVVSSGPEKREEMFKDDKPKPFHHRFREAPRSPKDKKRGSNYRS